jgi:hypothetical protein
LKASKRYGKLQEVTYTLDKLDVLTACMNYIQNHPAGEEGGDWSIDFDLSDLYYNDDAHSMVMELVLRQKFLEYEK